MKHTLKLNHVAKLTTWFAKSAYKQKWEQKCTVCFSLFPDSQHASDIITENYLDVKANILIWCSFPFEVFNIWAQMSKSLPNGLHIYIWYTGSHIQRIIYKHHILARAYPIQGQALWSTPDSDWCISIWTHLLTDCLQCSAIHRWHFQMHFFNENVTISIKISLKFVPKCPMNNISALVQMAWHRPGNKSSSEPMMVSLLTHICVTRPPMR